VWGDKGGGRSKGENETQDDKTNNEDGHTQAKSKRGQKTSSKKMTDLYHTKKRKKKKTARSAGGR